MSRAALILQHVESAPPGLLADWLQAHGIPAEVHHSYLGEPWPELDSRPFIACLGSDRSPSDRSDPAVADTLDFIAGAVSADVPVLGLCYGGQVLSHVMGGEISHAPEPEHGWYTIESDQPELVPEGPWLQWHYDRFTLPPGATAVAHSPAGLQAFVSGPHLGLQFHPESTIEIVREWALADVQRLAGVSVSDGLERVDRGASFTQAARAAAFQLFDAFWDRARSPERR